MAFQKRLIAIVVQVDIKGAFDSLQYEDMERALRERGATETYIKWNKFYWQHRSITCNYKGITVTRYPTQGSPQGAICSPAHRGALEGLGDMRILLLRNHVFTYINRRGLMLTIILLLNGSLRTNPTYAPKIGSYLILLISAHTGGCLWCEGEGCPIVSWIEKSP